MLLYKGGADRIWIGEGILVCSVYQLQEVGSLRDAWAEMG